MSDFKSFTLLKNSTVGANGAETNLKVGGGHTSSAKCQKNFGPASPLFWP